jgi:SAM-dependent methyltransferase
VQCADGSVRLLDTDRWFGDADDVDHRILERVGGPVLDIGCGPGRHVHALTQGDIEVLGMDLTADFVARAQRDQRPVLLQSVFDPVPGGARWRWALILDGSIGIGGNPAALLRRVNALLAPGGRVLVETAAPDEPSERQMMVIESGSGDDVWFDWATLSASDAARVARSAHLTATDVWEDTGRWFAQLEKR